MPEQDSARHPYFPKPEAIYAGAIQRRGWLPLGSAQDSVRDGCRLAGGRSSSGSGERTCRGEQMTKQNIEGAKPKPSLLRGPGLPKAQTKFSKEHSNFKIPFCNSACLPAGRVREEQPDSTRMPASQGPRVSERKDDHTHHFVFTVARGQTANICVESFFKKPGGH